MKSVSQRMLNIALAFFVLPAALTATAEAAPKVSYKLYADFLKQDKFTYKLQKPLDTGDMTYALTFYDTYGSKRYERKSISFCLIDLNGDGVKELVVARMKPNWTPKAMQLNIFTIRKGKVKLVRYMDTEDYSIPTKGQKLLYSRKHKALYCPAFIQNSDAYYDDETETYALYGMKGLKMLRIHYADSRIRHALDGSELTLRTYRYQDGSTSSLCTKDNEPGPDYTEYLDSHFKELDLKSFRMYRNTAANRKKLLGKA